MSPIGVMTDIGSVRDSTAARLTTTEAILATNRSIARHSRELRAHLSIFRPFANNVPNDRNAYAR